MFLVNRYYNSWCELEDTNSEQSTKWVRYTAVTRGIPQIYLNELINIISTLNKFTFQSINTVNICK